MPRLRAHTHARVYSDDEMTPPDHVWEGSKPRLNEDPSDHVWQGCQNGSKSDPLWMAILTLFGPPVSHWPSLAKRAQKDEGFGCKTDLQWVRLDTQMPIVTHMPILGQKWVSEYDTKIDHLGGSKNGS